MHLDADGNCLLACGKEIDLFRTCYNDALYDAERNAGDGS